MKKLGFLFILFLAMIGGPSVGQSDCQILANMERIHYEDYYWALEMYGSSSPLTIAKYNQWEGTFLVWLEFCTNIESPDF